MPIDKRSYVIGLSVLLIVAGAFVFVTQKNTLPYETPLEEGVTEGGTSTVPIPIRKKSAPKPVLSQTVAPDGAIVVTYTNTGFAPLVVKIAKGTSVRFVHAGNNALRIAPEASPAFENLSYPGLEQQTSMKKGDSFELSFSETGTWVYKNLNNAAHVGVVIVE